MSKPGLQLFLYRGAAQLLGAPMGQRCRRDCICHEAERLLPLSPGLWSGAETNTTEKGLLLCCVTRSAGTSGWILWHAVSHCICDVYLPQVLLCQELIH